MIDLIQKQVPHSNNSVMIVPTSQHAVTGYLRSPYTKGRASVQPKASAQMKSIMDYDTNNPLKQYSRHMARGLNVDLKNNLRQYQNLCKFIN